MDRVTKYMWGSKAQPINHTDEVEFVGFRCSGDNVEIALYVKLFPCVIVIGACDELRLIFIERIRPIVVNQSLIYVEGDHVGDVLLVQVVVETDRGAFLLDLYYEASLFV